MLRMALAYYVAIPSYSIYFQDQLNIANVIILTGLQLASRHLQVQVLEVGPPLSPNTIC